MFKLRLIEAGDNATMAAIIRQVLTEYGANRPGFAWQDSSLSALNLAYSSEDSRYWVIEEGGEIVGGAGVARLEPEVELTAELQKMYLLPQARGKGAGQALMTACIEFAKQHYHWLYLETFHTMTAAQQLYQRSGFMPLPQALIQTEHSGCDRWFLKYLQ